MRSSSDWHKPKESLLRLLLELEDSQVAWTAPRVEQPMSLVKEMQRLLRL